MPKKTKINKDKNHPKWGKKIVREIKKKILIADVKGVKAYAVHLK